MKWIYRLAFIVFCLSVMYFLGPAPKQPKYEPTLPTVPTEAAALEKYVSEIESKHHVKPDNEARIVWADSSRKKTKYAIVYLHGFSATQEEGNPVHRHFAKKLGCNLYLSRLAEHGIDTTDALINYTCDKLWQSAKEALAIGLSLGDSVILMGTSTGGTLNLMMAAQYPQIKAIINMSPNIAINDPNAWILNNPWGITIARIVKNGTDNVIEGQSNEFQKYWNTRYRLEAACELQQLVETSMNNDTYKKVTIPVLNLYYYKDEENQDKVVKVEAIKAMHEQLASKRKVIKAMPNVGDHVMGSPIKSKDVEGVKVAIEEFLIEIL